MTDPQKRLVNFKNLDTIKQQKTINDQISSFLFSFSFFSTVKKYVSVSCANLSFSNR
jgi:hypothetical protein